MPKSTLLVMSWTLALAMSCLTLIVMACPEHLKVGGSITYMVPIKNRIGGWMAWVSVLSLAWAVGLSVLVGLDVLRKIWGRK